MKIEKALQKLQLMYAELNPLNPDYVIVKISEVLSKLSKEIINYNTKKEKYVAIGYYSANIKIDIRNFVSNPHNEILFINALAFEFISDFLLFSKNADKDHFMYFFSKYMRNFENANGNHEVARFYNWIYSQYKEKTNFDYRQYISLAGEGYFFLMLHELVHTQIDLINSTIKLFQTPPTDTYFKELDESHIQEVACDFSALAYMDKLKIIEKFSNYTTNEILETVFLEIFSIGIYSIFPNFLNSCINNPKLKTPDILSKLIDITISRFQHLSLAIKVAQNSNMFFTDADISSIITNVNEVIQKYLHFLIEFLNEDLSTKVEEYNSFSEKIKQMYTYNQCNSIWKLFI